MASSSLSASSLSAIQINGYEWEHHFDPIDKEIYDILCDVFPCGLSSEQILRRLINMDPEENAEYRREDVWASLDIPLKKYLIQKGRFYSLKRECNSDLNTK